MSLDDKLDIISSFVGILEFMLEELKEIIKDGL